MQQISFMRTVHKTKQNTTTKIQNIGVNRRINIMCMNMLHRFPMFLHSTNRNMLQLNYVIGTCRSQEVWRNRWNEMLPIKSVEYHASLPACYKNHTPSANFFVTKIKIVCNCKNGYASAAFKSNIGAST